LNLARILASSSAGEGACCVLPAAEARSNLAGKRCGQPSFHAGEIQCPPLSRISNSFAVHICSSYPVQKQKLRSPKLL
jgi:hypothetical protein